MQVLPDTWTWEPHGDTTLHSGTTVVTVDFLAEGAATRVVVEQRGFADETARDDHDRGWNGCLDTLDRRVIGLRTAS